MLRAAVSIAVVAGFGCGERTTRPPPEPPPAARPPEPAAKAATPKPTPEPTEATKLGPRPMPEKRMAITDGAYARGKPGMKPIKLPRGHYTFRRLLETRGRRLLWLDAPRRKNRRGGAAVIYDLDKSAGVARLDSAYIASERAGVVVGHHNKRLALFDAATNAVVAPEIALPGKTAVTDSAIVAHDSEGVWILATGKDGTFYAGEWTDRSEAAVVVDYPVPFMGRGWVSRSGRILIGPGRGKQAPEDCQVLELDPGKRPRCISVPISSPFNNLLDDDWLVTAGGIGRLSGERVELPEGCRLSVAVANITPPRAIFRCAFEGKGFYAWAPGRPLQTFSLPITRLSFASLDQRGSVMPASLLIGGGEAETVSELWIDFDRGVLYRAPPMRVASYSGGPVGRRIFALRERDGGYDAVALDFDAGTAVHVATYKDCRKDIPRRVVDPVGDIDALVCHAGEWGKPLVWAEVFDHAKKKRWRTRLAIEAIAADGTVLASNRKREGGERGSTFNRLYTLVLR